MLDDDGVASCFLDKDGVVSFNGDAMMVSGLLHSSICKFVTLVVLD